MEPLTDPEALRDREAVEFVERTRVFDPEESEGVREAFETWNSHGAVGDFEDLGWFAGVPAGVEGDVATDVRLFPTDCRPVLRVEWRR